MGDGEVRSYEAFPSSRVLGAPSFKPLVPSGLHIMCPIMQFSLETPRGVCPCRSAPLLLARTLAKGKVK